MREVAADAILLFTNSFRTAWDSRQAGIPGGLGYRAHGAGCCSRERSAKPRQRVHQSEYYLHWFADWASAVRRDHGGRVDPRSPPPPAARVDAVLEDPRRRSLGAAGRLRARRGVWPRETLAAGSGRAGDRAPQRARRDLRDGRRRRRPRRGPCDRIDSSGRVTRRQPDRTHRSAAADGPPGCVPCLRLQRLRRDAPGRRGRGARAAIFGPTDERVTAPLGDHDVIIHQVFCRPCMLRDCPIDHRCMSRVSVDTVFDAVIRRLDQRLTPGART